MYFWIVNINQNTVATTTVAMGVYADSVQSATILAAVTGAWFKSSDEYLVGRGGSGGYNHFHDLSKNIHIWYGNKI